MNSPQKRKIAMLIMIDGAILDEVYFERPASTEPEETESAWDAHWFFY